MAARIRTNSICAFSRDDDILWRRQQTWMINFRVRNLDAMVPQLRAAGISDETDQQDYPNGRFAHLNDPEGNRIELWEPAGRDASQKA